MEGTQFPRISLAAARVNANLTQRELSKELGCSPYTVNNWENGKGCPDAIQLRKISELAHIPMDYIFVPQQYEKVVQEGDNNADRH